MELALGDSVAFGYQPSGQTSRPDYHDPARFVGYPELVGRTLGLDVVDASCPGETVASMISPGAPSNGCDNTDGRGGGYRTAFPLHTAYAGSQLAFAIRYLMTHRHVTLVTIDIGLNDIAVCAQTTTDACRSPRERSALASEIRTGLTTILRSLRTTAGYRGRLVALSYYSPTRAERGAVASLDAIIAAVTRAYGGAVADGSAAFVRAATSHGGDLCASGLLIRLADGRCDEHPTAAGQADLAAAMVGAARS